MTEQMAEGARRERVAVIVHHPGNRSLGRRSLSHTYHIIAHYISSQPCVHMNSPVERVIDRRGDHPWYERYRRSATRRSRPTTSAQAEQ